jgi:hypothetical protein
MAGMKRSKSSLMPAFIAALMLFAFLTAYVGSYLLVSRTDLTGSASLRPFRVRYFPNYWPFQLYAPLGVLEARLTGQEVLLADTTVGGMTCHYYP